MSMRPKQHPLMKMRAPSGVAGTTHGPAVSLKPQFLISTGSSFPNPFPNPKTRLSKLLIENSLLLMPFSDAFYKKPVTETKGIRYEMLDSNVDLGARAKIAHVDKWIKIGGKNGMRPKDVEELMSDEKLEEAYQSATGIFWSPQYNTNIGFIFDGDNYEPETAPFSQIIWDLIKKNYLVVAVKNADGTGSQNQNVSESFYKSWIKLAEGHKNFTFACLGYDIPKESLTKLADAFVFYGTTYNSKVNGGKDYRYRDDGKSTQGYSEVEALRADGGYKFKALRVHGGYDFKDVPGQALTVVVKNPVNVEVVD